MLFNSLAFLVFLPFVFCLHWFVFNKKLVNQNLLVLMASYLFYGWWDYRFLFLILASTLVDFMVARQLEASRSSEKRKAWLAVSLIFNLGLLGFFKYYNFFIDSWIDAWSLVGISSNYSSLQIILPVGISFYTFQTLSYTIDVYRKEIKPTNSFLQFAAFVSFFPQLVAGPIERAKRLLPQFQTLRLFNKDVAIEGFYLIVWGLFKKVVIADNCAFFVDQIFNNPSTFSSVELIMGAVLFGFQIYGDFSGYSDMAIGIARLFGFSLMINFKFPYFSRTIGEFWRRWHISLSTWFRDYVYIPLGGSQGSKWVQVRNIAIVFLISGLWHGAKWTFIIWGALHALMFIILLLIGNSQIKFKSFRMSWIEFPTIIVTFLMVSLFWIFFRADNLQVASDYLGHLFQFDGAGLQLFLKNSKSLLFSMICATSILVMLIFELIAVQKNNSLVQLNKVSAVLVVIMIVFMGVFKNPSEFIYFQF